MLEKEKNTAIINVPDTLFVLSYDYERIQAYKKLLCPKPGLNTKVQCEQWFNLLDCLQDHNVLRYEQINDASHDPLQEMVRLSSFHPADVFEQMKKALHEAAAVLECNCSDEEWCSGTCTSAIVSLAIKAAEKVDES